MSSDGVKHGITPEDIVRQVVVDILQMRTSMGNLGWRECRYLTKSFVIPTSGGLPGPRTFRRSRSSQKSCASVSTTPTPRAVFAKMSEEISTRVGPSKNHPLGSSPIQVHIMIGSSFMRDFQGFLFVKRCMFRRFRRPIIQGNWVKLDFVGTGEQSQQIRSMRRFGFHDSICSPEGICSLDKEIHQN